MSDAERVAHLAGDWDVASMTSRIPYPYTEGMARQWIGELEANEFTRVIERDGEFIGLCGYLPDNHGSAEIGYWLGKPYWRHGYATEAATALVQHCFKVAAFERLTLGHFVDNPASGRVIEKLGFTEIESCPCWCEARKLDVDAHRFEKYRPKSWRDLTWRAKRHQAQKEQD